MNPILTFDATFYLAQNADVAAAVAAGQFPDAFAHFQQFGQFELRDPNANFDTSFYLSQNADVIRGLNAGTITSAFQQFVQFGQFEGEGRAPSAELASFDEAAYLAANPDVREAVEAGTFQNGFAHFLQFGVNENRPSAPNFEPGQDDLSQALTALQDAQDARVDAVEALAAAVEGFDGTPATQAEINAFVAAFNDPANTTVTPATLTAEATQAVATEQAQLASAQSTLASARASNSDAALQTNLTNAITGLSTADRSAFEARNTARDALAADVAQDGSNVAVLTDVREAIGDFVAAGGDLTAVVSPAGPGGTPAAITVGSLLTDLNSVLDASPVSPAAVSTLLQTIGTRNADDLGATADGSAASRAALNTALDVADSRGDLINTANTTQASLPTAVANAEGAIATRDGLIANVAAEQADVAEAQANLATLNTLLDGVEASDADIVDAQDALTELNVENVVLVDGATEVATAEADLFVAGTTNSEITGFEAGEDVLFIGGGFTRVDLADDADFNDGVGSATTLEVFIQQTDAGAVVTFEQEAFGGNAPGFDDGLTSITLAGVDADDITIDANGFLRVTPEADALTA